MKIKRLITVYLLIFCILFSACEVFNKTQLQNTSTLKKPQETDVSSTVSTDHLISTSQTPSTLSDINKEQDLNKLGAIPLAYTDTQYGDGKICWISYFGGFRSGKWEQWENFLKEDFDLLCEKYGKSKDDSVFSGVLNNLVKPNQKFKLVNMLTKESYEAVAVGSPVINVDEGNFYYLDGCIVKPTEVLPKGFYICIFGDWDVFPNKSKVFDQLGSIKIDLDSDGDEETLLAEKYLDSKYSSYFLRFKLFNKKQVYDLDTMFEIGDSSWVYKDKQWLETDQPFIYAVPLDANGDGKMEIFFISSHYGSFTVEMFSIDYDVAKVKYIYNVAP